MAKKLFYTISTTGLNPYRYSIHKFTGVLEVDGKICDYVEMNIKPNPKGLIDKPTLIRNGVTEEEIKIGSDLYIAHDTLVSELDLFIDKFNRKDKAFLIGWDNRRLDDLFFQAWFQQVEDPYFFSWFWPSSIDVSVLATQKLIQKVDSVGDLTIQNVANALSIESKDSIDPDKDPTYKVDLIMAIYKNLENR